MDQQCQHVGVVGDTKWQERHGCQVTVDAIRRWRVTRDWDVNTTQDADDDRGGKQCCCHQTFTDNTAGDVVSGDVNLQSRVNGSVAH